MYDQLQPETVKEIMEGIITRLQRGFEEAKQEANQSQEKIKSMINGKDQCLREVDELVSFLVSHASSKTGFPSYGGFTDTENNLIALECDREGYRCECTRKRICDGLSGAARTLRSLKSLLESMKSGP